MRRKIREAVTVLILSAAALFAIWNNTERHTQIEAAEAEASDGGADARPIRNYAARSAVTIPEIYANLRELNEFHVVNEPGVGVAAADAGEEIVSSRLGHEGGRWLEGGRSERRGKFDATHHEGLGQIVPLFWHVPRSGSSSIREILGSCLGLTLASTNRAFSDTATDQTLHVVFIEGTHYVNVDLSTPEGIMRAQSLQLTTSGKVDVIVSPLLQQALFLYTPDVQGVMFAIFRDPIERCASLFYYLLTAKSDSRYHPDLAFYEIVDWLKSDEFVTNELVRTLTGKMFGLLTLADLDAAKEILRRKCIIGLLQEKEMTLRRLKQFFRWDTRESDAECEEKLLYWGWPNKNRHPHVEVGSEAFDLLRAKNQFDIELFEYAKQLFWEQQVSFGFV